MNPLEISAVKLLALRQDEGAGADEAVNACGAAAVDVSNMPLRIAAIFVILIASLFGSFLPICLARTSRMHVPKMTFFIFKYIGTGVIIATAWMHLLSPGVEALHNECLAPMLGDYDWAFAIGLMTVMVMFLIEMVASNLASSAFSHGHDHDLGQGPVAVKSNEQTTESDACPHEIGDAERGNGFIDPQKVPGLPDDVSYPPGGRDHLGHARDHKEGDSHSGLAGQLIAIFILEFGVVFHSIFIGLVLATSDELVVLLIVLTFHQCFEGLGLGSRLATADWPSHGRWWPHILATIYGLSTPLAIAVGIAARPSSAQTQTLVNGIFDCISAGILMYTGLVELLAHEFMFNPQMRNSPLKVQLFAFGCVALGACVMAILANWA
ncbi:ZIP zinc/iron transporter [Colletotrichum graminicola]|uniref:ZIP zinc/iron transporter n=1 Tax=Colletotrichum graminicola (strain M1.001 / M2 / FGSC 10212) TaxID=645133 RepID=E3Q2D1_COLGM|nr:ZIP zinc/iron transporter [Colletotrichum graminicola M1.001]EFQ25232.1 ZIP zinc/iron transporter [Colletotrichum graminicola M1.001]WDK15141.1 ZIP zinc/iron transporter [Colletotrichum graminicola]